jgi:hypothetical protein
MDTISIRFIRVLQSKVQALEAANKRGGSVYMDYTRARFGFAKSLIVHEITESILLIAAARRLGIQLAYPQFEPLAEKLFQWLQAKRVAKGDDMEVFGLVSSVISDFPRFQRVLELRYLHGQIEEPDLPIRIPETLMKSFKAVLRWHLSLLEQPTVLSYLEAARTLPRQNWNNLIHQQPSPAEVALAADTEEMTSGAVFFGFLFMASTMSHLNSAIGPAVTSEEAADSALLLEFVRGTLDWRLDFKTSESFTRFEAIKGAIAKATSRELPYRAAKSFEDEFELIINSAFNLIPA